MKKTGREKEISFSGQNIWANDSPGYMEWRHRTAWMMTGLSLHLFSTELDTVTITILGVLRIQGSWLGSGLSVLYMPAGFIPLIWTKETRRDRKRQQHFKRKWSVKKEHQSILSLTFRRHLSPFFLNSKQIYRIREFRGTTYFSLLFWNYSGRSTES